MGKHGGFTLLELLLVVVIVAVMSGLAVLSIADKQERGLQQAAERLVMQLEYLAEEAVFQQRPYGLQFVEQGYRSLVWDELKAEWAVFKGNQSGDKGITRFPEFVEINPQPRQRKFVQGREVLLADIIFYPDQEIDDFEVSLWFPQRWVAMDGLSGAAVSRGWKLPASKFCESEISVVFP